MSTRTNRATTARRPVLALRPRPATLALGATLLTASLALSACAGDTAANGADSGTFTLAVPVPLPSANPYAANTGAGQMLYLSYLAYDPLINETKSGKFVSGLASAWKATSTSATFTLRKDVTCSDGQKLTASQVAQALTFVGNPMNQYPWIGGLTPTVAYSATGDDGAGTVTVRTKQDFPFLLQTLGQVPIVCAPGLKDASKLDRGTSGTGPFVLESATQNTWTYRVRKGYEWGPDGASTSVAGTPKKLVLKIVTDPTTSANELLAGRLTATQVLGADADRVRKSGVKSTSADNLGSSLWFSEGADQTTGDPAVRRALVAAMNFHDLVKVHRLASGLPAERATSLRVGDPLTCPGADATKVMPSYDAAAAAKMLDEAGWLKGKGGIRSKNGKRLEVVIAYGHEKDSSVAQLLSSEWQKIGVDATIKLLTTEEKQASITGAAKFNVLIGASAMVLPTQFPPLITGPIPPKGQNNQQVSNPEYERLVDEANAAPLAKTCTLWSKAENSLMSAADIVPIAKQPATLFFSSKATAEYTSNRQPVPTSLKLGK